MSWIDDLNNLPDSNAPNIAQRGGLAFGGGLPGVNITSRPGTAKPKKKDKGFWLDQISTGGGIGGALAGAATGAAIGSAVPVVGTAIGGLAGALIGGGLGSGAGETAENVITGEKDMLKNVGKEALLGGVTSLPIGAGLKVAQAGLKAATGIGKTGTRKLLEQAGEKTIRSGASATTKRQGLGKNVAGKLFSQAFTLPRRSAENLKPEQTARELLDYGVSGSLDKINKTSGQVLSTVGRLVDESVAGIGGQVRTGDITKVASDAIKGVKITGPERKALFERVTNIGTQGSLPGYSSPSQLLEQIRSLERYGFARINAAGSSLVKNPDLEDIGSAYVQVARELEDNLYSAISKTGSLKALQTPETAKQLNGVARGLGDKFIKARDVGEVRSLMAPFVRAKNLVSTTMDEAQSAGSQGLAGIAGRGAGAGIGAMAGGIPGAAVGFLAAPLLRGVDEVVRAPIATGAGRFVNKLAGDGADEAARGMNPLTLTARQAGGRLLAGTEGQVEQPASLEDALSQQSSFAPNDFGSEQPEQPVDQNPYPRENLLYDLQRDPENADDYVKHYQLYQELFAAPQQELNTSQQKQLMGGQAATGIVDQIEGTLSQLGTSGRIGGGIANIAGAVGLNDTVKAYEDSRPSLALMLIKAIQGSAGQISDADRQAINSAIPSVTDTEGERLAKIRSLRNIINVYNQAALSAPGANSTIEDALMSAQGAY